MCWVRHRACEHCYEDRFHTEMPGPVIAADLRRQRLAARQQQQPLAV